MSRKSNHKRLSKKDKKSGKKDKPEKKPFVREEFEGIVRMTREGFAFIETPDSEVDIFVPAVRLRGALNNDRVRIVTTAARQRPMPGSRQRVLRKEGRVVEVLERSKRPHIALLQVTKREVWAIVESRSMPYDIRINMTPAEARPLQGMKVAVLVESWPYGVPAPLGKIVDVLGMPGSNDTEMHAILAEYSLPYRFEPEIEALAEAIPSDIPAEEIARRRDFRQVPTLTIDPTDAKDFDDALSVRRLDNGHWEIGVHIADVTHYVTPGSELDQVAYERATSVYLVDRTVPMLPEKLSNNLCSLRPNEDKLCFSVVFEMTDRGRLVDKWVGRTVICSDHRFDYDAAQALIEGGEGPMREEVLLLHRIASILRKKRFEAGAIAFERPEMKVQVDEEGRPVAVYQKISKEANWLIEEFMLLANRCVAEQIGKARKKRTFVYRIHENPNPEKVDALRRFAKLFGHNLKEATGKGISTAINGLLADVKGCPERGAIEILALRSMARAKYSTENVGHYGLAFDYYTHFTSPIRRYPDMMVHRLLALYLDGASSQDQATYEAACVHASQREQIAMDAERASIKYKLVEFMQDKVGQVYEGNISGLTDWGMYVEIDPTKVEGMVPLREIRGDFYEFDEETYSLVGKGTGRRYLLGDRVKIRVVRASMEQKLIDYELIEEPIAD